jgi:altronate dehydratase small subunit
MDDEIVPRVVMMTECFQIDIADNVATLLGDAEAGMVLLRGQGQGREICLTQPIKAGHKVALCALESGAAIVKYGVIIGEATRSIGAGEWVHLHNCRSRYDAQSSTLNIETGAREETPYV